MTERKTLRDLQEEYNANGVYVESEGNGSIETHFVLYEDISEELLETWLERILDYDREEIAEHNEILGKLVREDNISFSSDWQYSDHTQDNPYRYRVWF